MRQVTFAVISAKDSAERPPTVPATPDRASAGAAIETRASTICLNSNPPIIRPDRGAHSSWRPAETPALLPRNLDALVGECHRTSETRSGTGRRSLPFNSSRGPASASSHGTRQDSYEAALPRDGSPNRRGEVLAVRRRSLQAPGRRELPPTTPIEPTMPPPSVKTTLRSTPNSIRRPCGHAADAERRAPSCPGAAATRCHSNNARRGHHLPPGEQYGDTRP